jgi:hypothetical protein
MYYVLFETAETSFFDSIAQVYGENFAHWIREIYQELKRPDSRVNQDELDKVLKKRLGGNRGHLQCLFFSFMQRDCKIELCKKLHKCVLTKQQRMTVLKKLNEQKASISENSNEFSPLDRIFFQSNFEKCKNHVNDDTVCVYITHVNHQKYLNDYVAYIKRDPILRKAKHFVYVRGTDSSDYEYFSRSIKPIANLVPCDAFQNIQSAQSAVFCAARCT